MNTENTEMKSLAAIIIAALIILSGFAAPSTSDAASKYENERHTAKKHSAHLDNRQVIHRGTARHVNPKRVRHHRNVTIIRPHGHFYHGYGHYDNDVMPMRGLRLRPLH